MEIPACPAEARRAALVSFRGVERTKEEVRAARRASGIEVLARDVAMALRMIRRSPGVAAVVVLTLGVGIGAATAIFSVVDAAVLRPLPWADPGRLVEVRETTPQGAPFSVSEPNYLDFRPGIVGRAIELDGEPYVVTGVMPADFTFFGAQLWIPLAPDARSDRTNHWLGVLGRLAPGATVRQAQAELAGVSSSLAKLYPAMSGWSVQVRSLKDLFVGVDFRRASALLMGAVALLLLMACANAANLLLARAATRRRELGIRSALGAGRLRLLRQLLTESGLLALAGTGLGLLLAWGAATAVRAAAPAAIPRVENVTVNLRVLG
ncbi:MAG: ABC transporter permease, partial [Gemmatimonadota bacterium]